MILRITRRAWQGRVMDVKIYVIKLFAGVCRIGYELANQLWNELNRLGVFAASLSVQFLLLSDFSRVQKVKARR